jgi:hypothetical protein
MGSPVGVFTNAEVRELTVKQKKMLREHVVQLIQTSAEIRRIVRDNPKLLTKNAKIKKILRSKLRNRLGSN